MDTQAGGLSLDGSRAAGERSPAVLMLGRERVRDVLEPHLGATCALERANNIAQALAIEDAQPDAVAFEMLRQLPGEARRRLAAAVRREWLAVEFAQFRAERGP
ncbi:MAG: hypothetical protein JWN48_3508 [Myxococcaceae bacterium]|nr:hypothetical protein [Myxococcaceae bacterium]